MIKNCAVCGKEFERTHYNQIYCSLECQNKGHIKNVMDRKRKSMYGIPSKIVASYRNRHITQSFFRDDDFPQTKLFETLTQSIYIDGQRIVINKAIIIP